MPTTTSPERRERLLTIGAVCRRLQAEFPDISISKIRYLEDQGLLTPKRTRGGYRLFGEEDVERLQTILRLQRDEFLPLRVIRQELDSQAPRQRRKRQAALGREEGELDLGELCERAGIRAELVRELEEFGLLSPRVQAGERLYTESDVEVAAVCARLAQFGLAPRHLRSFRASADRVAGLLEQLVAPSLRSRNPERRQAAVEDLRALAEMTQELSNLLFWRDLRRLVGS